MYYTVKEMLKMIDEPQSAVCLRILKENRSLFQKRPGSRSNHQAWVGGYFDHVQEIMNIAVVLYDQLNNLRRLPFSLSDVLLVTFFHDIEKPWKYELIENGQTEAVQALAGKQEQREFRMKKLKEYGIELTEAQENGMKYIEGEGNDYSSHQRMMSPLAALCHCADVTSARLWFNHPMEKNDPWVGAQRIRDLKS